MGRTVTLITLKVQSIGTMPCNPSVGGLGKGHLVREVDAMGGAMGRAADAAGLHFRLLNRSKGPAVRGPRVGCDRAVYAEGIQGAIAAEDAIDIMEEEVVALVREGGRCTGVVTEPSGYLPAGATVVTGGTFLGGRLHEGLEMRPGGRVDEPPSNRLGNALRDLGLDTGRLKTGTPPRLEADSIEEGACTLQPGDDPPVFLSDMTEGLTAPQIPCLLTATTPETASFLRARLHLTPTYGGRVQGRGPRNCPSIEDKVVRFPDRSSHTIFLEPEGWESPLVYPSGLSTGLPADEQTALVRTIPGLRSAVVAQPGYAVEYDFVFPSQVRRTLEVRTIPGLLLAGQILGTTGYEEAAALGLVAGINAALGADGRTGWVPGRSEAYLGVLVDDLVRCDPREPYRMFTSRAEHRITLRQDNADLRLGPTGRRLGLVQGLRADRQVARQRRLEDARAALHKARVGQHSGWRHLKRPGAHLEEITGDWSGLEPRDVESLEAEARYEGYARRQAAAAARLEEAEATAIPDGFDYDAVRGLRLEAVEKLGRTRPESLGAASRIDGVTPVDLGLVSACLSAEAI